MLEELLAKIELYNPETNRELITKAYNLAEEKHEGQFRSSGEPYFIHPVAVANILADLNMDDATIMAGLLHDILEDTDFSYDSMQDMFGEEVTKLVDGVTKLKKLSYKSKQENQAENLRKMVLAMSKDIRVVIVKLADRLHNMRTLEYMNRNKQIEKATETLQIYAPLAHRLGINTIKWELEDLSLRYLEPEIYYELVEKVKLKRKERESFIQDIIMVLNLALDELNISGEISGRPKSIYSIYKKMYQQGKAFEELFDLSAVRVITDSIKNCYGVLGAVHTLWKPIPGRFKDYIAMPKPNLYQSLHTTVIGPRGEIFEVQIRTWEMHRTAEYGIAAHWKYKEGTTGKQSSLDQKLSWIRELMEWQKDLSDSREFINTIKDDFSMDEVFVFSPKGDVIDLPEGSTPIDFAYRVHSAVGNKCVGAKVDGRIVPLTYKLKTGNIVEILTSSNSTGPSMDWLKIVKSSQAKTKIKQYFKKKERDNNIIKGRDMLEKEVRKQGFTFNEILKDDWLESVRERMSFKNMDDMYASIGFGTTPLTQVMPKLKELHKEYYHTEDSVEELQENYQKSKTPISSEHGIILKGVDNIQIKIAKCCNPVPGDEIVGYITRGRGVSVHRKDCSNILNVDDQNRLIEVSWDNTEESNYNVEIKVIAFDRFGYLANLTQKISELGIDTRGMNVVKNKDKTFDINLIVEVKHAKQIEDVLSMIRSVKGTLDVYRVKM
ncbi:RelA/SpoT family protein [Miniphocaeibacter halophilus]|uniref:Bifunctional (P)ppGpp synthetase/guanosine-3',5'-bis(Diphosphate) 3'-pyrophosphohydrolase n=1 Tax=Miniphocaeibacter halophilus TaxID=2931922 RepID=A0AC61MQM4_9FIRM|nr:bifunctional (p)ppGpp synthetase/guanosine-3',5'-bis(diphosphate) 3'-pyrophosphohydrolase [Miniphocaeibacter halophilus]QQK07802.1 bifunctional (p)ppGpp synthetase/guanosine-3',5'-bis(diphosphate) 3'-pyrophosphohydrolase [Miniphocaeibacter halophilus]